MSSRFEQLQKMLAREPNDTFLLYGLALEHKNAGDLDQSLKILARVIEIDPAYNYAYYQTGQIHESRGEFTAARQAYQTGVTAATRSGDAHARSELQGALDGIPE